MKKSFNIIDGTVYLDKKLYQQAQFEDNNISKLTGSVCMNIFKTKPRLSTGIDSVTIDYHNGGDVRINRDPIEFVEEMRTTYQNKVRGHIVVDVGEDAPMDILINNF